MSSINGQDTSQITVQFLLNKNIDARRRTSRRR